MMFNRCIYSKKIIFGRFYCHLAQVTENGTKWELSWKRPENIPYPKVWHTFETTPKTGESKLKIKIQDIPPDRFKETIDFMETNFDSQEPLSRALKIWKDSESVAAHGIIRRKLLEQRISLMAVIDDETDVNSKSKMIGTLLLGVKSKNDPPTQQAGKELNKVFDLFTHLTNCFDPFQILESDRYILHWGVTVAPKYYGLGVGLALELQSKIVGKACGISGSSIIFTSVYSLPFWKKLGCTFITEAPCNEFRNTNGEVIIPNVVNGSAVTFVVWKYL